MPQNLSFQLYSARNHQPWDKIVPMVAKAGYTDVEGFGGVYDEPEKFRELLDANGLAMTSGHFFPLGMFETEKKKVIHIAKTLGMRNIYCPFVLPNDRKNTTAGWKAFGKRLSVANDFIRGEGYGFGWHNHDFEFAKLPDG